MKDADARANVRDSAAANIIRIAPLVLASLCSGCATSSDTTSLDAIKQAQRKELSRTCLREPERYGFPYTREEYMRLRHDLPGWSPDLYRHCGRVSRILIR